MPRGCPGAVPVARAMGDGTDPTAFWGHAAAHHTAAPWWRGAADKGGLGRLHPPALPQALTSTVSLTTLPLRILSASPTPVQLLPETSHPFPILGLASPSVCPLSGFFPSSPGPCSMAYGLPPASSPPLPFRTPGN